MTNIGDLLGEVADELTQENISVGDVHLIALDKGNGITPKNGDLSRNKFFVVLGFDDDGNVMGGVVINSKINYNLPSTVTDYQLPIKAGKYPFLAHDSFVNCSDIKVAKRSKFNKSTYRGKIAEAEMIDLIVETVKESPNTNKMLLKEFKLI